jgi:PIN domain nuclease of toxin-antitoxin system
LRLPIFWAVPFCSDTLSKEGEESRVFCLAPFVFEHLLSTQIEDNEIKLLPIEKHHLKELAKLPFHHRDPFDRLIISQGIAENLPILTYDRLFSNYPIKKLW